MQRGPLLRIPTQHDSGDRRSHFNHCAGLPEFGVLQVSQAAIRFQFGGHATFPVRYGWLPKGLEQLVNQGGFTANTETADELGLGSKMVESLAYWLNVTGLAAAGIQGVAPSPLADLIHEHDPYFELPGTWWFLHLLLARRDGSVWSWFFNDYADRIFDRLICADAFLQFARSKAIRPPSPAMAQRDVACLLSAYASRPGVDLVDPDDIGACPFRELGLLVRHEAVNRFERSRRPHGVPNEVFLACAALLARETGKQALSLRELATLRGGPGRVLCMGLEAIETQVGKIGGKRWQEGIQVQTLNGERHLFVPSRAPQDWLVALYARVEGEHPQ
ncbi:DUF4007 family protein [Mesorhizobium japonicum]|nr:DUF4007 family protein [Mesorhizobium japonicum]